MIHYLVNRGLRVRVPSPARESSQVSEGAGTSGRGLGRHAVTLLVTLAVSAVAFAVAAPGQALAEGKPRWEAAVVTVHVADEAAWAGTDVQAALDAWSPALAMTLTDDPGADVTLTSARSAGIEGATAYRDGEGSRITSCRVELAPKYAGTEQGATLAHELGHCLGLSHNNLGAPRSCTGSRAASTSPRPSPQPTSRTSGASTDEHLPDRRRGDADQRPGVG